MALQGLFVFLSCFFCLSQVLAAEKFGDSPESGRAEFNRDYVMVGSGMRVPTQEVLANELCLVVAALFRRGDLNNIPAKHRNALRGYLAHSYRLTGNVSLKKRLKKAVSFLNPQTKDGFDIEGTFLSEKQLPTVDKMMLQLSLLILRLAQKKELDQVNRTVLKRIFWEMKSLRMGTSKQLLRRRMKKAQAALQKEISGKKDKKIPFDPTHNPFGGEVDVLPLNKKAGDEGIFPQTKAHQKRLKRLATLSQQNLIDPKGLPESDQQALAQMGPVVRGNEAQSLGGAPNPFENTFDKGAPV